MKKIIVLSLVISTILVGCNIRKQLEAKENANKPVQVSENAIAQKLIGTYTGSFGSSKISLLISSAIKDSIFGRTISGTANNLFAGTIKLDKGVFTASITESGNSAPLGKHQFTVKEKSIDSLAGVWTPDSATKKITAINYQLFRKKLAYKTGTGIYPFTSTREITESDLSNLSNWEVTLMKNEILARHGMIFSDKSLKDAFETKDWYVPVSDDISADLTSIEKKNIETIDQHKPQ